MTTEKRIIGTFVKQMWTDPKENQVEEVERIDFDATDYVLRMEYDDFLRLEDNFGTSDQLGLQFVDWKGPCVVHITQSICQFFGVDSIAQVSRESFDLAASLQPPAPETEVTVEATVRLKVRLQPGVDIQDVLDNMDYEFSSQTLGGTIFDTEIVEAHEAQQEKPRYGR